MNNSNTYSGGTVFVSGVLQVGNNQALGSGYLIPTGTNGNYLIANVSVNISNPIIMPNQSLNFGLVNYGCTITLSGPITLIGLAGFINSGATFDTNNRDLGANVVIPNTIAGLGGIDMSYISLQLSGNNTFTGEVAISGVSPLILSNANALGIGVFSSNGGSIQNTIPVTINNIFIYVNGTTQFFGSSPLTFTGPTYIWNNPYGFKNYNLAGVTFDGPFADGPSGGGLGTKFCQQWRAHIQQHQLLLRWHWTYRGCIIS